MPCCARRNAYLGHFEPVPCCLTWPIEFVSNLFDDEEMLNPHDQTLM